MRISILFCFLFLLTFGEMPATQNSPKGKSVSVFGLNSILEERLNARRKGSSGIHLTSPVSGSNCVQDKIVFLWEGKVAHKLFLGLINNRNEEVFYQEISSNRFSLSAKSHSLTPGLYYWVLETEDEVLNMGKFYFQKPE